MYPNAVEFAQNLCQFINLSPTPWHVAENVENALLEKGFQSLNTETPLKSGRYVYKKKGSLIAFVLGKENPTKNGVSIFVGHTDSPSLRIKSQPFLSNKKTMQLGVEVYGGPILASFADRDLSLAGRLIDSDLNTHLVDLKTPLCRLANLPIHLNRQLNKEGLKIETQKETALLLGTLFEPHFNWNAFLKEKSGVEVLSFDLLAYPVEEGRFWGMNQEFIAHRQLDNLISSFSALTAFLENKEENKTQILALFDHEEIGSLSDSGGQSVCMNEVLNMIFETFQLSSLEKLKAKEKSFLWSLDGAHAFHPNYPQCFEPQHCVLMNEGVVLKINRARHYITDSFSHAFFQKVLKENQIPFQIYEHPAHIPCGSTVGPFLNAQIGIGGADVGVPIWAMHSCRESAGVLDCFYLKEALLAFLK